MPPAKMTEPVPLITPENTPVPAVMVRVLVPSGTKPPPVRALMDVPPGVIAEMSKVPLVMMLAELDSAPLSVRLMRVPLLMVVAPA